MKVILDTEGTRILVINEREKRDLEGFLNLEGLNRANPVVQLTGGKVALSRVLDGYGRLRQQVKPYVQIYRASTGMLVVWMFDEYGNSIRRMSSSRGWDVEKVVALARKYGLTAAQEKEIRR